MYEGVLGARPSTIVGSPDIRPEISEEVEGGVDMQMFGGRMALDATVFRKRVTT